MQLGKLRRTYVLIITGMLLGGWSTNSLRAADVELDRIEVYPAEVQPVFANRRSCLLQATM